jgi:hypothetical protein
MEPSSILSIDELLTRLAERHPRQAKALEMRIFGAISPEHIGVALGVSATQAKRDVAFARAWLVKHTVLDDEKVQVLSQTPMLKPTHARGSTTRK